MVLSLVNLFWWACFNCHNVLVSLVFSVQQILSTSNPASFLFHFIVHMQRQVASFSLHSATSELWHHGYGIKLTDIQRKKSASSVCMLPICHHCSFILCMNYGAAQKQVSWETGTMHKYFCRFTCDSSLTESCAAICIGHRIDFMSLFVVACNWFAQKRWQTLNCN